MHNSQIFQYQIGQYCKISKLYEKNCWFSWISWDFGFQFPPAWICENLTYGIKIYMHVGKSIPNFDTGQWIRKQTDKTQIWTNASNSFDFSYTCSFFHNKKNQHEIKNNNLKKSFIHFVWVNRVKVCVCGIEIVQYII